MGSVGGEQYFGKGETMIASSSRVNGAELEYFIGRMSRVEAS